MKNVTKITRNITWASLLLASTAYAGKTPIGRPPIPIDCIAPTLTQCENASYLTTTCGRQNRAVCGQMLSDQLEIDGADWATQSSHLPLDDDNPQYLAINHPGGADADTVVTARVQPYDYTSHVAQQLNSIYNGTVTRNQLASVSTSIFTADPRIGWQSDGNRVKSCEEFVYKRYRTFSRLEDDLAEAGTNYAAQFFITLFGEHNLLGGKIYDDRNNFITNLAPAARAKNAFFSFSQIEFAQHPPGMPTHAIDGALLDRHAAEFANPTYWTGGWDEQQTRGVSYLTTFEADTFERLDLKVAAFEDLVARRRALYDSWFAEYSTIERANCARQNRPNNFCSTHDGTAIEQTGALLARVQPQFVALDNQIDAAQHEGERLGCMNSGMTPCDWSPHQLMRQLNRQMNVSRDASFRLCKQVLNNDFRTTGSRLAELKAHGWTEAMIFPGDLNESAQMLEYVLEMAKGYVEAVAADLPLDPATGHPMVGASDSDGATIGNWAFGANYNYSVGFQLENLEAGVSYAQAHAWSNFHAGGTLFSIDVPLIDAALDVHSREVGATTYIDHLLSFQLVGQELLPDASGSDAMTFHVVASPSTGGDLFSASTIVPVGPIPVKVSGWLTGVAGVTISLDGGIERNHSSNPALDALSVDLRGKLAPFAQLDAHASASVDLLVVEAGIEGRITLVRLDLPFTMGLGVKLTATPDGRRIDSVLEGGAQLDLVLHTLDGAISVFVDTPWHLYKADLLSWEGYSGTTRLINAHFEPVNLSDLRDAIVGAL